MKKLYATTKSLKSSYKFLLLGILLISSVYSSYAQVRVPFTPRTSTATPSQEIYSVKGDFTMIGNSNVTLIPYSDNGRNDEVQYVDIDGNDNTFNSSSSTLAFSGENGALPECTNIIYAGLYWSGRADDGIDNNADGDNNPLTFEVTKDIVVGGITQQVTKSFDKRKVLINGPDPSEGYIELTANDNEIYYPNGIDNNMYSAYVEVTDYVIANGIGEYFVADIALNEGDGGFAGFYGGWGMVIIYENNEMKWRDITVFDGHAFIGRTTADYDIDISGFNAVQFGDVNVKIGVMAAEGDVSIAGDYFEIERQVDNTFERLSHSSNTTNNFFNSSILTGNARNPDLSNNTGLDIAVFDLDNTNNDIIDNGQTSTTFRYGTTADAYAIFNLTLAVEAYVPEFEGIVTNTLVNGSAPTSGDTLEPDETADYLIEIKNTGTEAIDDFVLTVPLPESVNPSDLNLNYNLYSPLNSTTNPNTPFFDPGVGANGSVIWNLGTLPLASNTDTVLADISFSLTVTNDCSVLNDSSFDPNVSVNGTVSGVGSVSNIPFSNPLIQGYETTGVCTGQVIPAPIIIPINYSDYVSESPVISVPSPLEITGCDENDITQANSRYPYSSTQSTDIKNTFSTTGYEVSDNGSIVSITYIDAISTTPSCPIEITRTYTATDDCGNTSTAIQTINITPDALTISDVPNETIAIGTYATQTDLDDAFALWLNNFSVSGGCNPDGQFADTYAAPTLCGGSVDVIYNVTDLCESGQDIATFTVLGANPLVISDVQDATVNACDFVDQAALDTAFNNWLAGFSVSGGVSPNGAFDDTYTAPVLCDGGTVNVVYNVTDTCGNGQDTATFTVNVPDALNISDVPNETIAIGTYATQTDLDDAFALWLNNFSVSGGCNPDGQFADTYAAPTLCGGSVDVIYNVTDLCESGQDIATFTVLGANPLVISDVQDATVNACDFVDQAALDTAFNNWLAGFSVSGGVSPNGAFDDTYTAPVLCDGGTVNVVYNVTDTCESGQDTATFTVIAPTAAIFDQVLPNDETVECDAITPAQTLTASNSCGIVDVAFTETRTDGNCISNYILLRTWTATNSCGVATVHTQTITVQDTTGPELSLPANVTAECSDDLSPIAFGSATATDNCDANPVITFNDVTTNGACSGTFTITRTWTATDACGNETSADQIISTSDTTAPEFVETLPTDITVECNNIPTAEVLTATDNCGSASVEVNDVRTDGACENNYIIARTWTATDDCGLTKTHVQIITVVDTTPPTFVETLPAANLVVECDAIPTAETLTATDTCGTATVSVNDVRSDGACENNYTIARTWTATDECGNETTHTQVIIVQDTTAPTFVETLPSDVTVECDNIPSAETLTATDNCGDATVVVNDIISNGSCPNSYSILRTWTATDACGNETAHTQTITVQDTTAPVVVSSYDQVLNVSCTDIPDVPQLEFSDNCSSSNNLIIVYDETNSFDENNLVDYEIVRTWIVRDECNNQETFTQTLNVTLDEVITEVIAEDKCYDDGLINLTDFIGDLNTDGVWEILEGDPAATITGNFFDPSGLELSEDFLPLDGGIDYKLQYTTTDSGCISITEVTMNINADCVVLPCGENDITISKAVTPNGDAYNEFFEISGVELCGFIYEVQIFNRWGALIYESDNYQNDWNGTTSNASFGSSGKVPNGTYYYIVTLKNSGLNPFTGPLYLATK